MVDLSSDLDGPPRQVQDLIDRYKVEYVILREIQATDQRVKQRRDWFGEFELAVAILIHRGGKLLLIKKSAKAGGFWSIPGGFKERGEEIEAAGTREAREETGLDVELLRPLRAFKSSIVAPTEGKLDYYLVLYQARIGGGDPRIEDQNEIDEARFVSMDELEQLISSNQFQIAHPSIDGEIIRHLQRILEGTVV